MPGFLPRLGSQKYRTKPCLPPFRDPALKEGMSGLPSSSSGTPPVPSLLLFILCQGQEIAGHFPRTWNNSGCFCLRYFISFPAIDLRESDHLTPIFQMRKLRLGAPAHSRWHSLFIKLSQDLLSDLGFPGGSDNKESDCNAGDSGFDLWVGKISWRRKWQPTPVFLLGEVYGQRSLAGYSPWNCKQADMTEQLTLSLPGTPRPFLP